MPMYDKRCDTCGAESIDVWESIRASLVLCGCGGQMLRAFLPSQKVSGVISDECDIYAQNGICNPDGSPRRFTSKSDMAKEAARRGLTNHVEHMPPKGSDKSPHTTRWI